MEPIAEQDNEIGFCYLLGLPALPTFGVYSMSHDYELMYPERVSRMDVTAAKFAECEYIPLPMRACIKNLLRVGTRAFEFYSIEYDGRSIINSRFDHHKFKRIRLNLVCHPFLFANKFDEMEAKVYPKASIYYHKQDSYLYQGIQSEKEPLHMNAENIENLFFEVYFHNDEHNYRRMSPNNSGAVFTTVEPINSFGLVLLSENNEKVCVFWNTVLWQKGSFLWADLYEEIPGEGNKFVDPKIMCQVNKKRFESWNKSCEILIDSIMDLFKLIAANKELSNNYSFLDQIISNFFHKIFKVDNRFCTEGFKNYLNQALASSDEKIYINFLSFCSIELIQQLLLKYLQNISHRLLLSMLTQIYLSSQDTESLIVLESLGLEMETKLNLPCRITEVQDLNHVLILFQNGFYKEAFMNFESQSRLIKSLVYEETWRFKGCLCGISDDFGKHSFHGKNIDPKYYCKPEDNQRILSRVIQRLPNST